MPTALELKREGWQTYLQAAQHRPSPPELKAIDKDEHEQLLKRVHKAAVALRTRFGAKRVILFGSLAHAAWFTLDSDVDLVVEGMPGEAYWQAWRAVEEIIGDRPVDLIEFEMASESLKKAVRRYGVAL